MMKNKIILVLSEIENLVCSPELSRDDLQNKLKQLFIDALPEDKEEPTKIELGYGIDLQSDEAGDWKLHYERDGKTIAFCSDINDFAATVLEDWNGELPEQKEPWIAVDDGEEVTISTVPPEHKNKFGSYQEYNGDIYVIYDWFEHMKTLEPGKLYRCRLEEVELESK